jgi:uncharacterized iron-regulated membrane protein
VADRGDVYLLAVIGVLFLLAVLGGARKWWKHRRETRAWLSGEDVRKGCD